VARVQLTHPERSSTRQRRTQPKEPEESAPPLSLTLFPPPNQTPAACAGSWYPQHIASALKSAAFINLAVLERTLHPRQPDLPTIRNFLLLQYPLALGTAIHATPLIPAIHATIPGARIAAAASGFALDILRGNPGLEQVVATTSPLHDLLGAVRGLRKAAFFNGEPFAVLQTMGNERSRITLAAMLSGAHTRVGFTVVPELSAAPLIFDYATDHPYRHVSQIANNFRVIETLGHGNALIESLKTQPELIEPQVFPSLADLDTARLLLQEQGIGQHRPIAVFITQTSPSQPKSWRPERFRAVAETLHSRYGMQIIFVGTASESPGIDALRSPLSFSTANIAGRSTLLELAAIMGLADIAITLDTGPLHLARAMRLPVVIIAPAWSPAVEWLPLGNPRARILKNADLPTAPPDYIIDEVTVADVERAAFELLEAFPPTPEARTPHLSSAQPAT
jgi:ADP-heptose:LPS heptosyltransferase